MQNQNQEQQTTLLSCEEPIESNPIKSTKKTKRKKRNKDRSTSSNYSEEANREFNLWKPNPNLPGENRFYEKILELERRYSRSI